MSKLQTPSYPKRGSEFWQLKQAEKRFHHHYFNLAVPPLKLRGGQEGLFVSLDLCGRLVVIRLCKRKHQAFIRENPWVSVANISFEDYLLSRPCLCVSVASK